MSYIDPWGFTEGDKTEIEITEKQLPPNYRRGRYRVEMRIYDRGILHHRRIRTNDLGIMVETDQGKYQLNTNWLFKVKHFFLMSLLLRLKGIRQDFYALYEKDTLDPFQFSLAYPKVSGGHLNTIKQSNALKDALKSWITTKFDTRMLIIILVVVGMMGIYLLYSMGYIDLSSIIKR